MTDWETHGCLLKLFVLLTVEEKISTVEAKPQELYDALDNEFVLIGRP